MSEKKRQTRQGTVGELLRSAVDMHKAGDLDGAWPLYRAALAANPKNPRAWTNLGALLRRKGHMDAAVAAHRRALEIDPGLLDVRSNLAGALRDQGAVAEAVALRAELLATDPDNWVRIADLAVAYRSARRFSDAIELIDTAEARLGPDEAGRLQRAFARLTLGAYAEGFADFESRYSSDELDPPTDLPWTRWNGEPMAGKTLLIMPEQGFGDAIVMARFLPRAKATGARITMIVKPPLRRLFAGLEGVDRIVPHVSRSESFDAYAPNISLPHLVGLPDTGPPPPPRLTVPDDSRQRARRIVAPFRDRFRIGIVWTGSLTYRSNHRRSASPDRFLGLAGIPGVQLFSLYKGAARGDLEASGMAGLIVDACGDDRDFADTAAIVDEMDLMITTDTAVVHVAATLGKPVWNLLSYEGFWLYGEGETTPWYPSMRLFRQVRPGDWDDVFARVENALRDHLARRDGTPAIEVPAGELVDRITILEIKAARIAEPAKRANVLAELESLSATRARALPASPALERLTAELKAVNLELWEIEDAIRDCERAGDFGQGFIELARSVYRTNDARAALKRRINQLLGSRLVEEKSYRPY